MAAPATASAYDPLDEAANFAKLLEREQHVTLQPDFVTKLTTVGVQALADRAAQIAADPERLPANVCTIKAFECAGDVRFYDWPETAGGIREPVVFTARSGATISGHVWATEDGPAKRPGIVITTGSVQAPEQLYWGQAATLAKHGYVVLTYDVQGQGASDTLGEGVDALEGVPSQAGRPFYDGTEDALDFLLSGESDPYVPRPSCTSGTSHAAKQARRTGAGLNAGYNPLNGLVDESRIGIAGHSLGASAVSFVGQSDPRVDAVVAWDNLSPPTDGPPDCASAPATRQAPAIAKPALGIANDYGIVPTPFGSDPDPQAKNAAFGAYRDAGVDTGELVIRGGCHEESALIPGVVTGAFPLGCGTLRGGDLIAWYTTAWFDKYVKGDPSADGRLLTDRWRNDSRGAAVDLKGDPNVFSFYFDSRLDFALAGGGRAVCDDLREGCAALGPDGAPADYDFVADAGSGPSPSLDPAGVPADGDSELAPVKQTAEKLKRALKRCKKKKGKKARKACRRKAIEKAARRLAGA